MAIETSEPAIPQVDTTAPNPVLGDKAPKTMEAVRAARYAAATDAAKAAADGTPSVVKPAAPAPGAPPVVAKPPEGSATIAMDEATLKAATALSREAREAKRAVKDAEAKVAEAAPVLAAKALVAAGKHLEAIKALGIDLNAAVAEELGGAGAPAEQTPEAKELARVSAELEAIKTAEAARAERDKGADAKAQEVAKQADVKAVGEYVKKEAAKYPFLARSDAWVAAAYEGAVEANTALVKEHGRELTDGERHNLVLAALEQAESEHVANAKLYGVAPAASLNPPNVKADPPPSTPSVRPTTFSGDLRGGTNTPVAKARTRMTFSEAKRARRDATNG